MNTREIITQIREGKYNEMSQSVSSALSELAIQRLDDRKTEIAKGYLGQGTVNEEVVQTQELSKNILKNYATRNSQI